MHLKYESVLAKSLLVAQFISVPTSKLLELLQYYNRATLVDPSTRSSFLGTITMLDPGCGPTAVVLICNSLLPAPVNVR